MGNRTLIYGGRIVNAHGMQNADVLIENERIARIGSNLRAGVGSVSNMIDASGLFLLPGGIDAHTHLGGQWEGLHTTDDWLSGTISAAAGGTTTVLNFCRPEAGEPLADAVSRDLRAAQDSVVDFGFHIVVLTADSSLLDQLPPLIEQGITSVKVFLAYNGLKVNDRELYRILQAAHAVSALPLVHCENGEVIDALIEDALFHGHQEPKYHALTRPSVLEADAIGRVIKVAELVGTPVYIPHISSARGLREVTQGRLNGQIVWGETCPQYLVLDESVLERPFIEASRFLWSPPSRTRDDQKALWEAVGRGEIDVVASDHGSYCLPDAERAQRDFSHLPNGGPTIEDRLHILYSEGMMEYGLSLSHLVALSSTNPAKIFGLFPQKGVIQVGSDADIVLWDPAADGIISASTHHMKADYSIFEGMHRWGAVVRTMVRGETVVLNGVWQGNQGWGRFVKRAQCGKGGT